MGFNELLIEKANIMLIIHYKLFIIHCPLNN